MSDDMIVLVPKDPTRVPTTDQQARATELLRKLAPDADEVVSILYDNVQFFDCGANFERVLCGACRAVISDWWSDAMDVDYSLPDGFALRSHRLPCCGSSARLNELVYEWPQAFGRYGLKVLNPNIGQLADTDIKAIEGSLGCQLVAVYSHI